MLETIFFSHNNNNNDIMAPKKKNYSLVSVCEQAKLFHLLLFCIDFFFIKNAFTFFFFLNDNLSNLLTSLIKIVNHITYKFDFFILFFDVLIF
jgi:hypothetical protein